jgi:2-polyprenyl-3-methyl-5-hydroxy-6-metoxy-1,4-benzoquinol methylase
MASDHIPRSAIVRLPRTILPPTSGHLCVTDYPGTDPEGDPESGVQITPQIAWCTTQFSARESQDYWMICNKTEFVRHYSELIRGKEFVEYESYYENSVIRFWKAFDRIQRLDLPPSPKVLDIGGGIMGVLLARIHGMHVTVGDVNRRAAEDIDKFVIPFVELNLLSDTQLPQEQFDLVILQEVIGHLPQPPYIVFRRIQSFMKDGGVLFITTPNGSRFRNALYLLAGRQVLDHFRYPEGTESLGVQHEYTLGQMIWQLERAEMRILFARQYTCGWTGETPLAWLVHKLSTLITLVPHLLLWCRTCAAV